MFHIWQFISVVLTKIRRMHDPSGKTKSRDENKAAATPTEQGNFYWERILCWFWILYKESVTMLLVSLVHQFIWPTFILVFTRNGIFKYSQKPSVRLKLAMTSIFIMSDRAAFRGKFRIEANQTSKVELHTCKIASWALRLQAVKHFHTKFNLGYLTAFPLGEKQHKLYSV